ncbi:helix-turn-helix transcriptional regulator [Acidovorax sp. A79]|uniref:helix-turn-helix transcriptional regulator n=1 Tax=Acidovorax sp. A79 TaxID=3056107 RepID=UPI0034E8D87F
MREESIRRIAGFLYDGVLSPQGWYDGLDALRGSLGAGLFDYFTLDTASSQVFNGVDNQGKAGLLAEKLREYQNHYIGHDLRMAALAQMPVGQIMLDHEHISTPEMSRNIVYTDFLRPHGFQHTLGARVRDEGGARDFLGFIRPADHAPYGANDKALVHQLMPDLRRAAALRARASHMARQAALGLAALDTLPQALAVVDAQCRIQYGNPSAHRLLASTDALRVRHGRLHCSDAPDHAQLLQHIVQACGCQGPAAAGVQSLAGEHGRLVVTVLPLQASHAAAAHWQMPLALVVITNPAAPGGLNPDLIGEVLGLSPAEARLALLLASGKTVKDFAALQGCTWNTARAHLAQLLRRTGCRRQTELVGLLQSLRLG